MSNHTWYESSTGNHQGLIIEEVTGRNVAVSYDKEDAQLIAAAPALLQALMDAAAFLTAWSKSEEKGFEGLSKKAVRMNLVKLMAVQAGLIRATIAQAEGRKE